MKRVEWYIAKVWRRRIDLWHRFDTEAKARKYVREDGPDTPFSVVRVTSEVVPDPSPGARRGQRR